jgi:hypothetical protein
VCSDELALPLEFGPVPRLCYLCIGVANSSGLFVLWMLCQITGSPAPRMVFCWFVCLFVLSLFCFGPVLRLRYRCVCVDNVGNSSCLNVL